ncbi:hypothetical protein BDZ94DRAFT_1201680 [Collybia nuda]|uniref:DNA-directed DNA polymerase n=1 Tax=Collybia nuda TaxID=64659 RepID=A0A9P5XW36_9AGAR|nr:hypothetical protein BDZ94DRAFT_1201680 [Collybia nuda]
MTSLKSGPSRLYLEVKERVAKHATSRRQNKVIKLATKDPMTNIAFAPDESSAIYVTSVPPSRSSSSVPGPGAGVTSKGALPLKPEKSSVKLTKLKKKVKPSPMTPAEYVRHLQEKVALELEKRPEPEKSSKRSPFKFLQGTSIFYVGGDMTYASERTRGRMDCIVKYGGNLLAVYDPIVTTHIITDAQASSTLRALGLKRLKEIPDHIPTIKWDWVAKAIGRAPIMTKEGGLKVRMDELFMHAAFSERIDAGLKPAFSSFKNKGKGKVIANEDMSHISEFTQDKPRQSISHSVHDPDDGGNESDEAGLEYSSTGAPPSPPTSPYRPTKTGRFSTTLSEVVRKDQPEDPLAEFYAKARAERDSGWSRHGEGEESDTGSNDGIDETAPKVIAKRGWTCDAKEVQGNTCVNQDIIDRLQELKDLHQSKLSDDDRWRVFSYSKCIRALRNHPKRIDSFAEARAIRGVGEKTAAKIMEIIETGGLRRIGYEKTDDVKATRLFQGIYGVGQSTAFRWYAAGCRTLDDVLGGKGGIKLTAAQEIGIQFYDDINDRMPRDEAKAIFDLIKPIALKIDAKLFVEIMGSYRRGKADCGDIDIMITRPTDDGKTHQGALPRLLRDLHAAGILTEDLAVPEDPNDLETIYRGLCRIPKDGARRRRIDFLTVPWQSRGAALLYYTGDDIFNRAIRWKAGAMGYSLNQKGLFSGVVRDPRDRRVKMNTGTLIASETEEEIFRILNVPWQEPRERVRG